MKKILYIAIFLVVIYLFSLYDEYSNRLSDEEIAKMQTDYNALKPKIHFGFDEYIWEKNNNYSSTYTFYDYDRNVELVLDVNFSKSGKDSYEHIKSVSWKSTKKIDNPKHPANNTGWEHLINAIGNTKDPIEIMKKITPDD